MLGLPRNSLWLRVLFVSHEHNQNPNVSVLDPQLRVFLFLINFTLLCLFSESSPMAAEAFEVC